MTFADDYKHILRNRATYYPLMIFLCLFLPFFVPYVGLSSGRHTFHGDYAGFAAGPIYLASTGILSGISLISILYSWYIWIVGIIFALFLFVSFENGYKNKYPNGMPWLD